jgi:REP element-mobilizing transposase RayT
MYLYSLVFILTCIIMESHAHQSFLAGVCRRYGKPLHESFSEWRKEQEEHERACIAIEQNSILLREKQLQHLKQRLQQQVQSEKVGMGLIVKSQRKFQVGTPETEIGQNHISLLANMPKQIEIETKILQRDKEQLEERQRVIKGNKTSLLGVFRHGYDRNVWAGLEQFLPQNVLPSPIIIAEID